MKLPRMYHKRFVRNFPNTMAGVVQDKLVQLDNCPSSRTAKEFYKAIYETMSKVGIAPQRGLFLPVRYSLTFKQGYSTLESFVVSYPSRKSVSATYVLFREGKVAIRGVGLSQAKYIPGLRRDICLGRNSPDELMPMFAILEDKFHDINY
ncbi:MAG: hypothetical protein WCI72_05780 [archaeon]